MLLIAASTENPDSEDALLQRALAMSMETESGSGPEKINTPPDLGAMTEEEQIAYAMRMSMQDSGNYDYSLSVQQPPSSPFPPLETPTSEGPSRSAAAAEAMDVDESKDDEDYSEAMNDPAYLQSVLESLPGVDAQSEAVRSAVGAIAGVSVDSENKKDDEKKSKEKDDKKEKK